MAKSPARRALAASTSQPDSPAAGLRRKQGRLSAGSLRRRQGRLRSWLGAHLAGIAAARWFRLLGAWLRKSWSALLVASVVLAVGVAAWANPGVHKTDVRLNEGQVYVQNQSRALIGSLNYQIDAIASATSVGDQQTSLLQEGNLVLVNNAGSSTLQLYDPASNSLTSPVNPPTGAQFSMNAGFLAVTNPENGRVWYGKAADLARSDFQTTATINTDEFGRAVVTSTGHLIGLNVQKSQIVRPDGSVVAIPFQVDSTNRTTELSAVGDKAIVFDRTSQQLWIEGSREPITVSGGSNAQLAPPMPNAAAGGKGAEAIYATQAGLIAIIKGRPTSLTGQLNANPVAPVVVGNCVYGAFGSRFVKVCDGGQPQLRDIENLPAGASLRFVTNRSNVVLQDVVSGMTWLVDKDMLVVNNWDQVSPKDQQQRNDPNPPDDRVTLPDRTGPNRNPIAQDDPNLGARAGRSTILPILDNDSDPDGDMLTLVSAPKVDGASLQVTGNGSGLQITLPADAKGSYHFTYEITDGRGGFAHASATVAALNANQGASNKKPVNIRPGDTLTMNSATTASKRVLVDWRDPDGDDLVLVNAKPETDQSEDEVTFTADGTVTFRDVGKSTGTKKVRVWVSDGTSEVEGVLLVDVRNRGSAPPVANGDFVTTMAGREVVVRPLLNDEGNNLTLTEVDPSTPAYTVNANYAENSFRFLSNTPGTYYLKYKVSNGPVSVGLVRIDVLKSSGQNNPPVAVRDVALVPFGGSVTIDPLLNDTDADNDVLVVQSVSSDPSLRVIMRERHLLTISSIHHTDAPVALTYWVSDGRNSTQGTIMVFPAPPAGSQAPRAVNDAVRVRAGSVATVPVLRNDFSPVGLDLKLDRLPNNPPNTWIDGDYIRVAVPAGELANTRQVTYEIVDSSGRRASATLNVTVISQDAQNEAPIPPLVEARVLAGSQTKIPISLLGIDPNGDSTRLLGIGSGPQLGRVTEIGNGWIRYQAYADSRGTDTFRYQVVDSFGAIGTGELRVGVAPKTQNNSAPIASPDEVTVRPGRSVTMPVLSNDYDVDGDSFSFAPDRPIEMDIPAQIVDNQFVSMTAPDQTGDYVGKYYIQDSRGAQGNGSMYLHVAEDAPLLAPVATDDQLAVNDILGKDWVEVDVLANDYDVDGERSQLSISLPGVDATNPDAIVEGNKVAVKIGDQMRQVRYQITDADANTAQALILVPGRNDSTPVLANPSEVHEVVAGDVLTIAFDSFVLGTAGRPAHLTTADSVSATKGSVTVRPEGIDFRADVRYAGPASVVFEVSDGAGPDDTTGKRAFLTVLIEVKPAPSSQGHTDGQNTDVSNRAPEGPANIDLQVGAGEPAETFNIRPQFSDPEGDNFNFESWQIDAPEGMSVSANVGNDAITAQAGVKSKGLVANLRGKVFDVVGASRDITATVKVVSSTRPLPVAQTDSVPDARAGQSVSVPVLDNDKSYLPDDPGLKLLSAQVVSGAGTAEVAGDQVSVTPDKDFVGAMVVRYAIVDATGDVGRQVDGAINLTVLSHPASPGTPVIEEAGNKSVLINWTSGQDNGMPVIARKVTATSETGAKVVKDDCNTNTCLIDGLVNNMFWTFHVVETNELGDSEPSAESAPGFPDVKPEKVPGVSATYPGAGNPGKLTVSWGVPGGDGSPVTDYQIIVSGSQQAPIQVPGDTTSYTVDGLTNGVNYTFQVQAKNKTNEWSDISEPSNGEHPSAPPSAPSNVVVADTQEPAGHQLRIDWTAPTDTSNDPIQGYTVVANATNGAPPIISDLPGQDPSFNLGGVENNVPYQVSVVAHTRGGDSAPSAPSAPTTATGTPTQPITGTVTQLAADTLHVQFNPSAEADKVKLTVYRSGSLIDSLSQTVAISAPVDLPIPTPDYSAEYMVYATGCTSSVFGDKCAQDNIADPLPAPTKIWGTPSLTMEQQDGGPDQTVNFSVASSSDAGTEFRMEYQVDDGAWTPFTDPQVAIASEGLTHSYKFRACDVNHEDNCSIPDEHQVEPPLRFSRFADAISDKDVTVVMARSKLVPLVFTCSVGTENAVTGPSSDDEIQFTVPKSAGTPGEPAKVTCDDGFGGKYIFETTETWPQ